MCSCEAGLYKTIEIVARNMCKNIIVTDDQIEAITQRLFSYAIDHQLSLDEFRKLKPSDIGLNF